MLSLYPEAIGLYQEEQKMLCRLAELESKIAENDYIATASIQSARARIEEAILDQNDKLEAIMNHLGIELEKNPPKECVYVAKKTS